MELDDCTWGPGDLLRGPNHAVQVGLVPFLAQVMMNINVSLAGKTILSLVKLLAFETNEEWAPRHLAWPTVIPENYDDFKRYAMSKGWIDGQDEEARTHSI